VGPRRQPTKTQQAKLAKQQRLKIEEAWAWVAGDPRGRLVLGQIMAQADPLGPCRLDEFQLGVRHVTTQVFRSVLAVNPGFIQTIEDEQARLSQPPAELREADEDGDAES